MKLKVKLLVKLVVKADNDIGGQAQIKFVVKTCG